ncbi:MAG TPA: GNAT family N-acetyltransferase [Nitrospirae bacterium]|nr:GNAT family N-acetyltransferase [Nitrospirota bacterium]
MKQYMKILKSFSEIEPFLPILQSCADKNRKALGFFTKQTYEEQALQGRIWIAISSDTNDYAGHLMFGGTFPLLKIFQVFVNPNYRRSNIATKLIKELVSYGESGNYISISCRVAADLRANSFWEKNGFVLIRQEQGKGNSKRTINIRIKELNTPTLFTYGDARNKQNLHSSEVQISYINRPISNNPSYVIDLNVFFDVVRNRPRNKEASLLISAGFNNQIRVCVTTEFSKELEKHSDPNKVDPVLSFAERLPTLPPIDQKNLEGIISKIGLLVFPEKMHAGKLTENDRSDLLHLASCIHHRVYGFVTNDKAILKVSDKIRQNYGLDIVSSQDFIGSDSISEKYDLKTIFDGQEINSGEIKEHERQELESFLSGLGISLEQIVTILDPGISGSPRRRVSVRADNELIAVASWDAPSKFMQSTVLYLFVDEHHPTATKIIDHVLETVSRDTAPFQLRRIDLSIGFEQVHTKQTALQRGFCLQLSGDSLSLTGGLSKVSYRGIITPDSWHDFTVKYKKLTGLALPSMMPNYKEFINTGIVFKSTQTINLKLFEFETLISPALLLCRGREAIILPIRRRYADELLHSYQKQTKMFPYSEALLHVERAYFKTSRNTNLFKKGLPVIFYVSGKEGGSMEAVGSGRITFSDVLSYEEIDMNMSRQGVLSKNELSDRLDSEGKIHVFTFDNFNLFANPIPFNKLRALGLVSAANLITSEKLKYNQFIKLCKTAYDKEQLK